MIRNKLGSSGMSKGINGGPELTPLIDIVFIVLVFLLLTSNVPLISLPIDIPQSDSALDTQVESNKSITIALEGSPTTWHIEMRAQQDETSTENYSSWEALKSALLTLNLERHTSVLVAPDASVNAESLLQVLALLNERQLLNVQILMEPKKSY